MEQGRNWLNGDNFGIIIAGSDTTASTLIFIRTELEHLESGFDGRFLQSLPHLNGLINETLHFHPPIPSAGLRETLLEGLAVADRHIPGYTTRFIPVYSLHRRKLQTLLPIHFLSLTLRFSLVGCRCASWKLYYLMRLQEAHQILWNIQRNQDPSNGDHAVESCFERPLDFIPLVFLARINQRLNSTCSLLPRWLKFRSPRPASKADSLSGHYGCVGTNLALLELSVVTVSLVQRLDISFVLGSEISAPVTRDVKYQFTITPVNWRCSFNTAADHGGV